MSTPTPYRFQFDATSDNPNAMPYVSRLHWNTQLARIEHHVCPLERQTLSDTSTRVYGEFTASSGEIIETRRGAITRKRKTLELLSWFLVTPRGYLLLIGEGRDAIASERIARYLQGTCSANDLGPRPWDVTTAVSDWRAITTPSHAALPARSRIQYLLQRKHDLEQELHEIALELDSLTATAKHA
jgi:hypothetical protein